MGATPSPCWHWLVCTRFNPRPRDGATATDSIAPRPRHCFNRRPGDGATRRRCVHGHHHDVSIPAPVMGATDCPINPLHGHGVSMGITSESNHHRTVTTFPICFSREKNWGKVMADRQGLSLLQLQRMFPDDASAEAWIKEQWWPDGPICPHCGSFNVQCDISHPAMTHRCRDCPKRPMFSLKTGTVMEGTKLGPRIWVYATYLMATSPKGVSSLQLSRAWGSLRSRPGTWRTG